MSEEKQEEVALEAKVEDKPLEEVKEEVVSEPDHVVEARKFGHMSLEEWTKAGKDPDDWKGAKAFLKDGELHGKLKSQAKELDNVKNVLRAMNDKLTKAQEIAYKKALDDLKRERNEAIQLGETEKAEKLESQVDEIKKNLEQTAVFIPPANQLTPEAVAWIEERQQQWFNDSTPVNAELSAEAKALDASLANLHPNMPIVERFNLVESRIKKMHPEVFTVKKEVRAPMVSPAKQVENTDKKRIPTFNELPEDVRKTVDTMAKVTGQTREEYIKQLQDSGVL